MLMQHCPTLLNGTFGTRLATMLHDIAWGRMMLKEVWFSSNIVFNIVQYSLVLRDKQKVCMCSTSFNAYTLTKLTLRLSMAMVCYDFLRALLGESSSYRWQRNTVWIYQSLSNLKYKPFFSKGKRKGKDVRPGKARRWSITNTDRCCAIFWANPHNAGFFFQGFWVAALGPWTLSTNVRSNMLHPFTVTLNLTLTRTRSIITTTLMIVLVLLRINNCMWRNLSSVLTNQHLLFLPSVCHNKNNSHDDNFSGSDVDRNPFLQFWFKSLK